MKEDVISCFQNSLSDTFQNLAFMFIDDFLPSSSQLTGEKNIQAFISFSGAESGVISLIADSQLCVQLAQNILGTESNVDNYETDVLGEVLNHIGGKFLTDCFGEDSAVSLGTPVVLAEVKPVAKMKRKFHYETNFYLESWECYSSIELVNN